jgi:hypothetical protein
VAHDELVVSSHKRYHYACSSCICFIVSWLVHYMRYWTIKLEKDLEIEGDRHGSEMKDKLKNQNGSDLGLEWSEWKPTIRLDRRT